MDDLVLISNIQQFCTYDGPGIRTVVFFKGCPLKCRWCQNPEDLADKKLLLFQEEKCSACGKCISKCQNQAFTFTDGRMVLDRKKCNACGDCIEACYFDAKSICGTEMTADQVFQEVMKDEIFFRNTGGGITLSGGECTMHPEFVMKLLQKCRENDINTVVETCGFCKPEVFREIAQKVDLFLYDFKLCSSDLHKQWIGQSNELIKENLEYLFWGRKKVIIRIPLVIGINDGAEFAEMMQYLAQYKEKILEIHIMPFHQFGSSKYELSGIDYSMQEWKECSTKQAEEYAKKAESYGFMVNIGGWDYNHTNE